MSIAARKGRSGLLLISLCALVALGMLLSFGTWQIKRLAWKEDLIATIEARGNAEQVSLQAALPRSERDYVRVLVTGTYAHGKAQRMYDVRDGVLGWKMLTPLVTQDGKVYWADRGFIPDGDVAGVERPDGQVTVSAALRTSYAPQGAFTPGNAPATKRWYWFDQAALDASAGVSTEAGVVLQLGKPDHSGQWPSARPVSPKLSNKHLGYAMTWFGLAITLLGVYIAYVLQYRRNSSAP